MRNKDNGCQMLQYRQMRHTTTSKHLTKLVVMMMLKASETTRYDARDTLTFYDCLSTTFPAGRLYYWYLELTTG